MANRAKQYQALLSVMKQDDPNRAILEIQLRKELKKLKKVRAEQKALTEQFDVTGTTLEALQEKLDNGEAAKTVEEFMNKEQDVNIGPIIPIVIEPEPHDINWPTPHELPFPSPIGSEEPPFIPVPPVDTQSEPVEPTTKKRKGK